MAIIAVILSDAGNETVHWEVPPDNALNLSAIPRGRRIYSGTGAIAALGSGNETNVALTFSFPTAFVYLPKVLTISFISDDTTSEFENLGVLQYSGVQPGDNYALVSDGPAFIAAAVSIQTYRPVGTWRHWLNGPDGDTLILFLADMSMDTSTAGDVVWAAEFWEYDVEQCLKWPVNTPQPIVEF